MPSFVRLCCVLSAVCLGAAVLLLAIVDIVGVLVRLLVPLSSGGNASLDMVAAAEIGVEWALWISAVIALPCLAWVYIGPTATTRAFRSPLSVYPGAAAIIVATLIAVVIGATLEGGNALHMVLRGVVHSIDAQVTCVPIMAALVGTLLTGGRVASAGAILSGPVLVLSLLGMLFEQSVARTMAGAVLPFLLLAGALALASIPRGGATWRLVWPLGAVAIVPFAAFLLTGLFTPRELLSFALVAAVVIGLAVHGMARGENAWRFAMTVAVETGALVIAIAGYVMVMIVLRLLAIAWGEPLAGLDASEARVALAIVALAYTALGAALTPLAALVVALPFAAGSITAGLAPLSVMVILAIAAMLGLIVRLTAWHHADALPAPDDVTLPRTGGAIALGAGIAIIAALLAAPETLLAPSGLM